MLDSDDDEDAVMPAISPNQEDRKWLLAEQIRPDAAALSASAINSSVMHQAQATSSTPSLATTASAPFAAAVAAAAVPPFPFSAPMQLLPPMTPLSATSEHARCAAHFAFDSSRARLSGRWLGVSGARL